jgi:hypothetical protein
VLLTEAIAEANDNKESLYVAYLDTQKAFDVVWHASLLRKLYKMGITGKLWLVAKAMYTNMKGKVKWLNGTSRDFNVKQGVLQGGSASATLHKTYENPLLLSVEERDVGLKIGTVYLGNITVADDKVFMDKTKNGLQACIDIATNYSNRERYINSIGKSEVMMINDRSEQTNKWHMNDETMAITQKYTHVGITRTTDKAP